MAEGEQKCGGVTPPHKTLSNVAPTILGIERPPEITAESLLPIAS
jgi:hypothetical protein